MIDHYKWVRNVPYWVHEDGRSHILGILTKYKLIKVLDFDLNKVIKI